jgi:hypothetical protein
MLLSSIMFKPCILISVYVYHAWFVFNCDSHMVIIDINVYKSPQLLISFIGGYEFPTV